MNGYCKIYVKIGSNSMSIFNISGVKVYIEYIDLIWFLVHYNISFLTFKFDISHICVCNIQKHMVEVHVSVDE